MEAALGFSLDFWDYVTFAAISVMVLSGLALAVFVLGLPGRIAIARNHPEADAVNLMGWVGFVAIVPWIQALIWAFKPTDVIDIRNLRSGAARDAGNDRAPQGQGPRAGRRARARAADCRGRQTVMMIAILIVIAASAIFWLIFFKLKWLRLTPGWALIFAFFVLHLTLVFLIGLRFVTPNSANA